MIFTGSAVRASSVTVVSATTLSPGRGSSARRVSSVCTSELVKYSPLGRRSVNEPSAS
ncbi:hypothetical protein [Saccharothrix texasensis]|uniref:hypothetical protein n=1 Tax=Saccharothrix texasensis TaxID=103734 RepID=UPI001FE6AEBF|nr:hypothetical protein [Saccharothrix texasensis]